jgi:MFS family permease
LTKDLRISSRKFIAAILLNSGTLAWFFLLIIYLPEIFAAITLNDPLWSAYDIGSILFFGFAILWSIIGSVIGGRISRRKLLIASILLGTFSMILLAIVQGTFFAAICSLFLGMSMGLGLPSSMALIADYTDVEERARVSGTVILGTFVMAFTIIAVIGILNLGILDAILLFAIVRSTSMFALVCDKCDGEGQKLIEKTRLPSGAYREFFFYLIPWVMFSIAAGLASNLIPPEIDISTGTTLRYVFIAVFGFVSGVAADRLGRKQPIIIGLIVLGASFALIGFFGMSQTIVTIYLAISGMAWGSFFVVFLAVPGDLSVFGLREKFYGLGYILPISILFSLSAVPVPRIFPPGSASSFSQILSLLLFLSIIPVLRAKETLPDIKMRERRFREYAEKVGKVVQESKETDQT